MKQLLLGLTCILPLSAVFAESKPLPYPQDTRIKRVAYQDNNVVPIKGIAFTTTQIVFGKEEHILKMEGGDTAGWMVTLHPTLNNMFFIKPTVLDSNSNLTVITNKYYYYFQLKSAHSLQADPAQQTFAVKFSYPEEERVALNATLTQRAKQQATLMSKTKNPKYYNWDYRYSGNRQIMPLHVFDDGTFTYFELRKNQAVPAIFAVDNAQGKEAVVNTRREGAYLVVQRLAPQFTLRNGGHVASVFNSNAIVQIKQGRG